MNAAGTKWRVLAASLLLCIASAGCGPPDCAVSIQERMICWFRNCKPMPPDSSTASSATRGRGGLR